MPASRHTSLVTRALKRSAKELATRRATPRSTGCEKSRDLFVSRSKEIGASDAFLIKELTYENAMLAGVEVLEGYPVEGVRRASKVLQVDARAELVSALSLPDQPISATASGRAYLVAEACADEFLKQQLLARVAAAIKSGRLYHGVSRYGTIDPISCIGLASCLDAAFVIGMIPSNRDRVLDSVTPPWAKFLIDWISTPEREHVELSAPLCEWLTLRERELTSSTHAVWMASAQYRSAPFELIGFCRTYGIDLGIFDKCPSRSYLDAWMSYSDARVPDDDETELDLIRLGLDSLLEKM